MLKKRNIGRRGQASVEYLMFIVVIVTIVAGLASYSSSIESRFESAKEGLRNKLAGDYDLKRSDFFSNKIGKGDSSGGGQNGTGGTDDGTDDGTTGPKGGKKPVVKKDDKGDTNAIGQKKGEGNTIADDQGNSTKGSQQTLKDERDSVAESNQAVQEYQIEEQTEEEAEKQKEKEAISERQLAMASAEEKAALLRKAHEEGLYTDKEKDDEAVKWNIGKIIVIIVVVILFLIIILKSREGRD